MPNELTTTRNVFTSSASQTIMKRLQSEAFQKQAQATVDQFMADMYRQREQARKNQGFSFLR